jgi:DNA-binding FrmR family transcriptional regulator
MAYTVQLRVNADLLGVARVIRLLKRHAVTAAEVAVERFSGREITRVRGRLEAVQQRADGLAPRSSARRRPARHHLQRIGRRRGVLAALGEPAMRFIFMPGAKLFLRLSNEKKLPLMTALFLLPLAALYLDVGMHASLATKAWVAGGALLAVYAMVSFYIQADMGWRILIKSMQGISEGDLTTRIDAELGGHFGLTMKMLEKINQSLGDIVRQVRASSQTVANAAREIAEANANLSQRTERQATTLEETASAMEEFSST